MYLAKVVSQWAGTVLSVALLSACGSGGSVDAPSQTPSNPSSVTQNSIAPASTSAVSSVDNISSVSNTVGSSSDVISSSSEVVASSSQATTSRSTVSSMSSSPILIVSSVPISSSSTPSMNSSLPNSSEASSSEVSSSEASSSEVSSSEVSSSEVSSSEASSSEVSSSEAGSSEASIEQAVIEYIYPTQGAHIGGATSIKLALNVKSTNTLGEVTAIRVADSLDLVERDGFWVSTTNLSGITGEDNQTFDVQVQVDNVNWLTANALQLNNLGGKSFSLAGSTRITNARGLAVASDGDIFFSDPLKSKIYQYDPTSGKSQAIYEAQPSVDYVNSLNWPIVADGGLLYALTDSFQYSQDINSNQYNVSLVVLDTENDSPTMIYNDRKADDPNSRIGSTRGIVLDKNSIFGDSETVSGVTPHIYALDFQITDSSSTVQKWRLADGRSNAVSYTNLDAETNLLAIAQSPKTGYLYVIHEFEDENKRGKPALVQLKTLFDIDDGYSRESSLITSLPMTLKPTAIIFDTSGDYAYIADVDRIIKMKMSDYTYQVISATPNGDTHIGNGSVFSGSIRAMALHPSLEYLYVAAGLEGLWMIDLETGDRVVVAK